MEKIDFLRAVVAEDVGRGDLFARVSAQKHLKAGVWAKSEGVFAGREYIETFDKLYEDVATVWMVEDGDPFENGMKLFEVHANSTTVLAIERTLLNIALHASSIATVTRKYVDKIASYGCRLLDTRKTRPMLREFEKYAVRCGGGVNHRFGLDDCLMLKDTHLRTIVDLENFVKNVRNKIPFTSMIEIECEDFSMVEKAMEAGADIVMCDNMSPTEIRRVVEYRNSRYPHILIEASGNVTLDTIEKIAATGVDAISSGSIVHQAQWPDFSMRIEI